MPCPWDAIGTPTLIWAMKPECTNCPIGCEATSRIKNPESEFRFGTQKPLLQSLSFGRERAPTAMQAKGPFGMRKKSTKFKNGKTPKIPPEYALATTRMRLTTT